MPDNLALRLPSPEVESFWRDILLRIFLAEHSQEDMAAIDAPVGLPQSLDQVDPFLLGV